MRKRLHAVWFFLVMAVVGLSYGRVQAGPITFAFEATVGNVSAGFPATLIGQTISGQYTLESMTVDILPGDPNLGGYFNAATDLSFTLDGYTGSFDPTLFPAAFNLTAIVNDGTTAADSNSDQYFVNIPFTGDPLNGFDPTLFVLDLINTDATALNSDLIPQIPPDLSLFDFRRVITLFFDDPEDQSGDLDEFIEARVTSLTLVPEPSSLMLVLFGVAWFLALKRRAR
jgi:hypothetical protein